MGITEFGKVMQFIANCIGKEPATEEAVKDYYLCLRDLPLEVLQAAAIVVVNEHVWKTFPTVAEIRKAAVTMAKGVVAELTPAEAWQLAWTAVGKIDLELTGNYARIEQGKQVAYASQAECVLSKLPPIVQETMRAYGLPALCYGTEEVSLVMARFLKLYEQIAGRNQRLALLPEAVKADVARIGSKPVPALAGVVKQIGMEK